MILEDVTSVILRPGIGTGLTSSGLKAA